MGIFYALVDALPGREADVEAGLRSEARVLAFVPCKERSHDFLVAIDAAAFDKVDDILQTRVRGLPGVGGVEVVTDWDDYGSVAHEARARLDRGLASSGKVQ